MKKAVSMVFATFIAIFSMANVMAANVAKIGDVEYATIDAAVAAWKPGEMIELLADIERDSYFVFSQNTYALDGKGHTIKCTKAHSKSWKYFVNANAGTQTFKNIIIDGNGKVPFVMQAIDGGKLILENVTIKGAKTTTTGSLFSRSTSLGYGIHVNDGSVEAKNITITNCEVADVYQDGASSSFNLSGDNCNVNFIGSSSAKESVTSTAKGYYAYEVTYKSSLGNGTAKTISNKSLNGIIDQVQRSITTIVASFPISVEIKSATVKLLQDVVLAETFTSNDTKLTINGNGKTVTGTFKFTSTPSVVSGVVLGNGSILDCTASMNTGFSSVSVAANTSIDILLPASTDMNSYALPVALATDAVANIFVGDKKYIAKNGSINPAEKLAQIGDKQYATLQEAINAANGATVQVLKDVALTSSLTVPAGKTLTLNLAGCKVTVSGADYALVNNGNLKIVDMGLVTVVAAEATIGDEPATPILIMAPSVNDGVAVIDDATGGSIAGVQNNGTFALESGAVIAASATAPAIDNTANAKATITGGTVEGKLQSVDKTALTITGGSFTGESNVSDFVGGDYGVDSNGTIVKNVAKIGDVGYATFEEAVSVANEIIDEQVTITLLADTTFEGDDLKADLILDLNGKTITATGTYVFRYEGGSLIVKDSSVEKTGMIDGSETVANAFLLFGDGVLEIEAGVIHANNNVIYTYGSGNAVTVNGGELKSYIDSGNIFYLTGEGNTISVNDGVFIGNVNPYAAGLSISGGVFTVDVNNYCASGFGAILNSDGLYEIVAVDASSAAAKIGDEYFLTLNAALQVAQESDTIVVLKDYQGELNTLKGKLVPEEGKTVTITATNEDWYYLPYDFEIGSGVTLNMPNGMLFVHYTDSAVINGNVTALGLYIRYAGTKLIVNEPGSLTILSETFYIRDVASDVNAGIYINGDNDDTTIGLKASVIYFYQGMISAKDANVKVGTYWQTQETDAGAFADAGSANLILDNTKMQIGPNENIMKATGNSTVTLKNGSKVLADSGYIGVAPYIDATSSMTKNGVSVFVAKVGEIGYLTLQDAFAAARDGDTVTLFSDVELNETLTVAAGKSVTLDLAGFTIESSTTVFDVSGALTLYGGTLIVTDSAKDMFTVAAEGSVTLKHGQFSSDVTGFCADGVICVKQPSGLWAILPDATVETLNPMVLKVGEYSVLEDMKWPPKDPAEDSYLGVVMRFTANDTEETIAESPFKDYATDFYITISGMEGDSFIADENTFLVGNYGDFGWIKIPLKGMKIEDGVRYPVLGSVFGDSYFTYEFICTSVREMLCAMTISPEIIAANPNLKVVLDLAVTEDPESGDEPLNVGGYDYSAEAFMPAVARIGEVYYRTLADAFAGAQQGDTVELLADVNVGTLLNLPAEKALTLDLNGKTVSSSAALNNAGELTVRDSSAEKTGKFNMAIVNSGKLAVSSGYFGGTISGEGEFAIAGGTFVQDVAKYCVAGCQSVKQPGENLWQVGKLPNAEVVNMGPTEISDYRIWGGGSNLNQGTGTINLQVALDFIAKDSDKEAHENAYGQYVTDFYITIDGAEGGSFVADGCYLAGNYGEFGWIMIPLDGMSITNGVMHPVITSAFAGSFSFSYEDICTLVKDFKCGIYFSEEVLDANPRLTVSLNLGLSESLEQAQNATFTPVIENPFVFDVKDMTSAVAVAGPEYFTSFADAVTAAIASGEEVKVVANAVVSDEVVINKNLSVDLNGKTLTMAGGASIKVENAAVKFVGGTFADLSAANIALSGNATLTLPAKVDEDFGSLYTSENADESFTVATKFQSCIQVVDNVPCIGFLKDTARAAKYKLMGKTALDDGSDWAEVSVEPASEAVANPYIPLYWVKPAAGEYRFFKVVIAE